MRKLLKTLGSHAKTFLHLIGFLGLVLTILILPELSFGHGIVRLLTLLLSSLLYWKLTEVIWKYGEQRRPQKHTGSE
jgi:hypothetical protein